MSHVRAELAWVHRLLRTEIRLNGDGSGAAPVDEFAGLYIPRAEIDRYVADERDDEAALRSQPVIPPWRQGENGQLRAALDRQIEAAVHAGTELRFERVARAFGLDAESRVALWCVLAAELDADVPRVLAYLQNNATQRRPTLALLTQLVTGRRSDPLTLRTLFGPASPLTAGRLIETAAESAGSLPAREAAPASGLVEYLLGMDALPPALAASATLSVAPRTLGALTYHRHHQAVLDELHRCRAVTGHLPLTYIAGPPGSGRGRIAEAFASALGRPLLSVHWARFRPAAPAFDEVAPAIVREARLRGAIVLIDGIDDSGGEPGDSDRVRTAALRNLLELLTGLDVIATGSAPPAEVRHRLRLRLRARELPYPTTAERIEMWANALSPSLARQINGELPALAEKFRFTPGQIVHALEATEMAAERDPESEPIVTSRDLHARCREEAQRGLHLYCEQIVPRFDWDDIVLRNDLVTQLREICQWVRHGARVYDEWGFGIKLSATRGVSVLFSGPSGTGKTMSAEVIASDLQLDLFRVDLSRVVSKYIGETEKNLARIFEQSAVSNCVLFFDEADALFGKRTEVKDAHDRYANIEVNYLLSQMDRYQGLIIVATNLKGNLDPAFIRRFSHVVEYPVPNERLRETIWRKSFPRHTPLSPDLDFAFLAQQLDLSGANIRNIALTSAFLASADAADVTMQHVIRAARREYQKIGRICSKSDFGQYYSLVREGDLT